MAQSTPHAAHAAPPRRKKPRARGVPLGNEVRAAVTVLDAVLRSVEAVAWETRKLAADAALGFSDAKRGFGDAMGDARRWRHRQARLAVTSWMLTKVASSYRWHELRAAFTSDEAARRYVEGLHAANAARFYATSAEQGGAFLKVGQLLSARPDVMPAAWVTELSKLQDAAPAIPWPEVAELLTTELGAPLETHFAAFDTAPIAAASIGQVHRAVTHSGLEVAVKVQRPGIGELVDADMALLELFLESLATMLPRTDYATIAAELTDMIRLELDYRREAEVTARMAGVFPGLPGVRVPRIVPELCTGRVLTTTFERGRKIATVLDELAARGDAEGRETLSDLLGRLLEAYLVQVLGRGEFQADPHPGNFLVAEDGALVLLDFGCTKQLPELMRTGFGGLLSSFVCGDTAAMAALFGELGFVTASGRTETLDAFAQILLHQFRLALTSGESFRWPEREEMIEQMADVVEQSRRDPVVRIPPEFVMLGRVFSTLAGLFTHYRPTIDWTSRVLPHVARAAAESAARATSAAPTG